MVLRDRNSLVLGTPGLVSRGLVPAVVCGVGGFEWVTLPLPVYMIH